MKLLSIIRNIPSFKERIAKLMAELLFGENAQEDFHCETALREGTDDYGRVFVDFDEKRRQHVVRCMISGYGDTIRNPPNAPASGPRS